MIQVDFTEFKTPLCKTVVTIQKGLIKNMLEEVQDRDKSMLQFESLKDFEKMKRMIEQMKN